MSLEAPDPVTGQAGELLERFVLALNALSSADQGAFKFVTSMLTNKLRLAVSTRRDGGDRFVAAALAKLQSTIATGISEDLLVIGARETVTQTLRRMSTDFDRTNANRAETRRAFERILEDPVEMQKYIELRTDVPVTEEEVRAGLTDLLAGPNLKDIDAEGAAAWWAMEKSWTDTAGLYLSDGDVSEWASLRASRPHDWSD